jgi:hypothetical protein
MIRNFARPPVVDQEETRVSVESPSLFAQVIQDHLELKRRNSDLEGNLPIDRYKSDDPFDNHPLFKTEEQARLEETLDGVESPFVVDSTEDVVAHSMAIAWPGEETAESAVDQPEHAEEGLWGRSRDFDWGD